jgi:hypothetical protein
MLYRTIATLVIAVTLAASLASVTRAEGSSSRAPAATARQGETTAGIRADGLRLHAEARAYGARTPARAGETAAGIRADGLRLQGEEHIYLGRRHRGRDWELAFGLIALGLMLFVGAGLLLLRARGRAASSRIAAAGSQS